MYDVPGQTASQLVRDMEGGQMGVRLQLLAVRLRPSLRFVQLIFSASSPPCLLAGSSSQGPRRRQMHPPWVHHPLPIVSCDSPRRIAVLEPLQHDVCSVVNMTQDSPSSCVSAKSMWFLLLPADLRRCPEGGASTPASLSTSTSSSSSSLESSSSWCIGSRFSRLARAVSWFFSFSIF